MAYYRRISYPVKGHADVPDELWEEFQRIRGHLSSLDQNNVASGTLTMDKIAPPTGLAREGVSDIVDTKNNFLYESRHEPTGFKTLTTSYSGAWYDLARRGVVLKTRCRGDSPWLVAASVGVDTSKSNITGNSDRGTLRLRVRSSAEGLSSAEAVGGFNSYCQGAQIATTACFLVRGGAVEFSPVISFESVHNDGGWVGEVTSANIFAVGLYR